MLNQSQKAILACEKEVLVNGKYRYKSSLLVSFGSSESVAAICKSWWPNG